MSVSTDTIECTDCGAKLGAQGDSPKQRIPCNKCGSTKRNYHVFISEAAVARDGIGVRSKRAGDKKPYIEDMAVPEYSRSLDKVVYRERVIDRDNDRYLEQVTDYESGKVIHRCEEPLSKHQGHGHAKPKNRGENG